MKIVIPRQKPRNPLAVPARGRRAGSHRPTGKSMRRNAARALQRELDTMKPYVP